MCLWTIKKKLYRQMNVKNEITMEAFALTDVGLKEKLIRIMSILP